MGTDANRNYGLHWGEEGASTNPCDEAFMGSAAWSEVENRNLRHFLTPRSKEVKFFNTLHSYGQVIIGFSSYILGDGQSFNYLIRLRKSLAELEA